MDYSIGIVFATRPNIKNLQWILMSLDKQTYQNFKVYILIDQKLIKKEFEDLQKVCLMWLENISEKIKFISNISNPDFRWENNVSYIRNYGLKITKENFVQIFDDDEKFDEHYLKSMLDLRLSEFNKREKDFVLVPTVLFRDTKQVQTYGFSHYNYRLSRPEPQYFGDKKPSFLSKIINNLFKGVKYQNPSLQETWFKEIQMCSMNSVFWPKTIFDKIKMDPKFDFIYEDLDFSYRIFKSWYKILVTNKISIQHMERDKTLLEHAWVGNKYAAYRKAKHKMLFIKKHANFLHTIQFYVLGFWAQPLRLFLKIVIYWWKNRWALIAAHLKGIKDWMKYNLK